MVWERGLSLLGGITGAVLQALPYVAAGGKRERGEQRQDPGGSARPSVACNSPYENRTGSGCKGSARVEP